MSDPVRFFDPRPPVGLLCETSDSGRPAGDAVRVELLDAALPGSGKITLEISRANEPTPVTVILADVREAVDGGLVLQLDDGRQLVFARAQRDRVSGIILKLSTSHY